MARALDPDLKAALQDLLAATKEHKRASERLLAEPHNVQPFALERAVCQVCDAAHEVAVAAHNLGISPST